MISKEEKNKICKKFNRPVTLGNLLDRVWEEAFVEYFLSPSSKGYLTEEEKDNFFRYLKKAKDTEQILNAELTGPQAEWIYLNLKKEPFHIQDNMRNCKTAFNLLLLEEKT